MSDQVDNADNADNKPMVVPDYLKEMLDQASLDNLSNAASSSGPSFPRISLKGRTFRFKVGGEEVKTSREPIDVIILGISPDKGLMRKTLYLNTYNPQASDPPDCSSSDGIRPDSHIGQKMCQFCAQCKYNQWGSDVSMTGKKSKKCRDSKILFVVDAKEPEGTMYALTVTVASLKALSEYGSLLLKNGVPFAACVTRLDFADTDYPQITFQHLGVMKQENCAKMLARAKKEEWADKMALLSSTSEAIEESAGQQPMHGTASTAPDAGQQEVKSVKNTTDVDSVLESWGSEG